MSHETEAAQPGGDYGLTDKTSSIIILAIRLGVSILKQFTHFISFNP